MEQALLAFSHETGIFDFMHSPWGWPVVESLHFFGLSLLIGTVGVFDLRMLGLGSGIAYRHLHRLVPVGVLGYALNVVTGTMFLSSAPDQYLYNPAFQTKLGFMLLAGCNVLWFYTTCSTEVRATADFQTVRGRAKLIGTVSLLAWCAIIVCGRLITYYRPPYHWCFWC